MSCRVLLNAWPRCSAAVTFGGGMTIEYGLPPSLGSAWKHFSSIQVWNACASTDAGSYVLGKSFAICEARILRDDDGHGKREVRRLHLLAWRAGRECLSWRPILWPLRTSSRV